MVNRLAKKAYKKKTTQLNNNNTINLNGREKIAWNAKRTDTCHNTRPSSIERGVREQKVF